MHNFMHYDLIIMLTSNSKSISLKHSQNVCRSNFPVTLKDYPSFYLTGPCLDPTRRHHSY